MSLERLRNLGWPAWAAIAAALALAVALLGPGLIRVDATEEEASGREASGREVSGREASDREASGTALPITASTSSTPAIEHATTAAVPAPARPRPPKPFDAPSPHDDLPASATSLEPSEAAEAVVVATEPSDTLQPTDDDARLSLAPPATVLLGIDTATDEDGDGLEIVLRADGTISNPHVFTIEGPDRLVVDLKQVASAMDRTVVKLDSGRVERIRSGMHDGTLRLVFDAGDVEAAFDPRRLEPLPDGLRIRLGGSAAPDGMTDAIGAVRKPAGAQPPVASIAPIAEGPSAVRSAAPLDDEPSAVEPAPPVDDAHATLDDGPPTPAHAKPDDGPSVPTRAMQSDDRPSVPTRAMQPDDRPSVPTRAMQPDDRPLVPTRAMQPDEAPAPVAAIAPPDEAHPLVASIMPSDPAPGATPPETQPIRASSPLPSYLHGRGAAGAGAEVGVGIEGDFDCIIEPYDVVEVGSALTAVVHSVAVERSDFVEAGQVLAQLESSPERAAVEVARARAAMDADVIARQARMDLSRKKQKRADQLFESQTLSADLRDEIRTEAEVAKAVLEEAREAKRLTELEYREAIERLDEHTIKSPISGVVVDRLKSPGEVVKEETIVVVAQIDPLRVEVILPAAAIGTVRPGMRAEVFPEIPKAGVQVASVTVVDRVIDATSGTFGVRLELPNPDYAVPSGLRCQVRFLPVD